MVDKQHINFQRIEAAILYLCQHFKEHPSLDEIAAIVHLSPHHFQRVFSQWVGVSPKQFMRYLSLNHAKQLLRQNQTLLATSHELGLSGPSRLHDLFLTIEGMTPGEFKGQGGRLRINYSYYQILFGQVIIASTSKGICYLHFIDNEAQALLKLKQQFPQAEYIQSSDDFQINALSIFQKDWQHLQKIKLHLKGTAFQLKVWECLLQIPSGALTTYGHTAEKIQQPAAARAVGMAVGQNPIAYLIPCHRVIQKSGHLGGYRWGEPKKQMLIAWESAHNQEENH